MIEAKILLNKIIEFFQNTRSADILDISFIAGFIYLILVWLKKARARFILIGMLIITLVYILARFLGLYLTTLVFQGFFAIFLFMVVVIFQEDIRRFFERIAVWGFSQKFRKKMVSSDQINVIVSAVNKLCEKKIGALIVIKGKEPLERHIEAGVELDGILSTTILETLFDPYAPSHDGAVIIDGSRIVKFSAHLPLSTNIEQIGRLGTRHAAALGISERTDSLCVVVSEEKSTLSVAWEGKIIQLSDNNELINILNNFYQKNFAKPEKPIFLEFITGHSFEKITAIILAVGLWFVFGHRTEIIVRDFTVPIEYRNLAPERIIGEPKPKQINITISGTERAFNLLKPEELKLSLDMSTVKDGKFSFAINKDMLKLPKGLSLVNSEPDSLELSVYRLIPMEFPIKVITKGKLPSDIKSIKININPEKYTFLIPNILDPQSIEVKTENIDLSLIKDNTQISAKLIVPPELRAVEDRPLETQILIEVEKK